MGPVTLSAFEYYQQMEKKKKKNKNKTALTSGLYERVAKEVKKLSGKDGNQLSDKLTGQEQFVFVPKPSVKNSQTKQEKKLNRKAPALNESMESNSNVKKTIEERLKSSGPESKQKLKRLGKSKEAKMKLNRSEGKQKLKKLKKAKQLKAAGSNSNLDISRSSTIEGSSKKDTKAASPHQNGIPEETVKPKKKQSKKKHAAKSPVNSDEEKLTYEDSRKVGKKILAWMLAPIGISDFLQKYWEKRPLFIKRPSHRNYFTDVLSSEEIDRALREHRLYFTRNLDVTSYVNGVKEVHNPVGRAFPPVVWDFYRNGCSVRILNPQTFFPKVRSVCTSLQECFNSFVGANVYLTPPNSQGFAPHYDDIEAFVLQLEGKKKWKVYSPMKGDELPRSSSANFTQEELGEPLLDIELQPGDALYMPRGFIHQATTVHGIHSLHITVSTYQHNSWADFMEKVVPAALTIAIAEDPEFREGIPWDFLQNMGAVSSTDDTPERTQLSKKIKHLFSKLFTHAPLDAAADQLARDYFHEYLPPMLSSDEKKLCAHGDGDTLSGGVVSSNRQLSLDCAIKLVRHSVLRVVSEDNPDTVRLYHCADNSLVYKEEDEQFLEIAVDLAPAVEALIQNYPAYMRVSDLPLDEEELKLQVALDLWEHGLVMTEEVIPIREVTILED